MQMKCGVVEWMKRNTLRWHGHVKKEKKYRMVQQVSANEVVSRVRRLLKLWEMRGTICLRKVG